MRKISKKLAQILIKETELHDELTYSVIEVNGVYYVVEDTEKDAQAAFDLLRDVRSQRKVKNAQN